MRKRLKDTELLKVLGPSSSSQELTRIVRSLLRFIVLESREYVHIDKREEYVKNYLFLLTKATNGLSNYVDMDKVKEQILLDINHNITEKTN